MAFPLDALQNLLICPKSGSALILDEASLVSVDPASRLRYQILDDIPILLAEDAKEVPLEEWRSLMSRHGRDPLTGEPRA